MNKPGDVAAKTLLSLEPFPLPLETVQAACKNSVASEPFPLPSETVQAAKSMNAGLCGLHCADACFSITIEKRRHLSFLPAKEMVLVRWPRFFA